MFFNMKVDRYNSYIESEHTAPYTFFRGAKTKCTMISAPHCVNQLRNGKIKKREKMTGVLALLLNSYNNCHAIIKTKYDKDDPNYDTQSNYRDSLAQYVKDNGIRLLIDLHQMADTSEYDICIGTGKGKNIHSRYDLLDSMIKIFEKNGIAPVSIDKPFAASNCNTVSADISHRCHIPCFQIEINKKYLYKEYDSYKLKAVFDALSDILDLAEKQCK